MREGGSVAWLFAGEGGVCRQGWGGVRCRAGAIHGWGGGERDRGGRGRGEGRGRWRLWWDGEVEGELGGVASSTGEGVIAGCRLPPQPPPLPCRERPPSLLPFDPAVQTWLPPVLVPRNPQLPPLPSSPPPPPRTPPLPAPHSLCRLAASATPPCPLPPVIHSCTPPRPPPLLVLCRPCLPPLPRSPTLPPQKPPYPAQSAVAKT